MKPVATTPGLNSTPLMKLPKIAPSTAAGNKPMRVLAAKRCAAGSWRRPVAVARRRWAPIVRMATTAPVWTTTSKTPDLPSLKPIGAQVRIRWPVDETGRNSLSPSTTP
jgi:hypothetical protein